MRRFVMPAIKRSTSVCIILLVLMIDGSTPIVSTTRGSHFDRRMRDEEYAVNLIADLINRSDRRVRPGVFGPPTEVKIDFFVQTFGPLDEVEMEFSTDLSFRQTWHDPRFSFSSLIPGFDDPVYIPEQDADKFWLPDLYFPNDKHGTVHQMTLPNRGIQIYPNGTIQYSSRMSMRMSCTMYLDKFPLDSQICHIKISTFSYDSKEVILTWLDNAPIEIHPQELQLPQFAMVNYAHENCIETYKTGNYSCIQATFFLERRIGFFILQTYIPSILIVVLSWVGFWIDKDRIALGVTTILTMTTQLTTSRSNSMRVSYLKAVDVWHSSCMLFVFATLMEYAIVNAYSQREQNAINRGKKNDGKVDDVEKQEPNDCDSNNRRAPLATSDFDCGSREDVSNAPTDAPTTGGVQGTFGGAFTQQLDACRTRMTGSCGLDSEGVGGVVGVCRKLAKRRLSCTSNNIDRFSRWAFPISFGLFNLVYWLYYLTPPHFHCQMSAYTSPDNCIGHEDDSFQFMFDGKRQ